RGIAVSRELAYDFLRLHQPFIYPKTSTPDLLDEIAKIKHRIERDIVGTEKLERDVKLGRGGIRDIEFIVQTLQLMHGARHPFLQEVNMLKALRALRELDLLPTNEVLTLDQTYRFLRRVEHRLQIEAEQQTHVVQRSRSKRCRFPHRAAHPTDIWQAASGFNWLACEVRRSRCNFESIRSVRGSLWVAQLTV